MNINNKFNYLKYVTLLVVATFLTFFFHETSHWLAYKSLGYEAGFTLNGASLKDSTIKLSKLERIITSAAGPIFTVFQAIIFYIILKKYKNLMFYPFLFLPFVMRLGAGWANRFGPNDEGRISLDLNLNLYTFSVIIVAFLFILVFKISKNNKISIGLNIISFLLSIVFMFCITNLDFKYKLRLV